MPCWYRPAADAVGHVPATPRSELARMIQAVVTEEARRLNLDVKIAETGGVKVKDVLCKLDLTGCVFTEAGCLPCDSGLPGASHTRGGAEYMGVCVLCEANGVLTEYRGESGSSARQRFEEHREKIVSKDTSNAFAKHLAIFHPDHVGDVSAFRVKSVKTFKKCLERQVSEGVSIAFSNAKYIMNSRSEWHQPALPRVTHTKEPRARGS